MSALRSPCQSASPNSANRKKRWESLGTGESGLCRYRSEEVVVMASGVVHHVRIAVAVPECIAQLGQPQEALGIARDGGIRALQVLVQSCGARLVLQRSGGLLRLKLPD